MVDRKTIYARVAKTKDELNDVLTTQNTTLSTIETKIDTVDTVVDTINTLAGTNSDDQDDSTLYGQAVKGHIGDFTGSFIYPTGTSSTSLTDGSYTEVIPASTITNPFRIMGVFVGKMTTDGWYQYLIAKGAASSEVDIASTAAYCKIDDYTVQFTYGHDQYLASPVIVNYNKDFRDRDDVGGFRPVTTDIIAANSRISVKLTGAGGSVAIKLLYQEYS